MLKPKPNSIVSNLDESVRLFQSSFFERISHTHPAWPVVLFGPVILYFGWRSFEHTMWWQVSIAAMIGLLIWSLVEYLFHRVVFHYEPKTDWGKKFHFLAHGVHHAYPNDSTRLVLPPIFTIPAAFMFYWVFANLAANFVDPIFSGFAIGYVFYDITHFATHNLAMKSRVGRWIKQYHMLHHYTDEDHNFGVSSPLWDYVFGTVRRK